MAAVAPAGLPAVVVPVVPPAAVVAGAPPVQFTLFPGSANPNATVNYNEPANTKLFIHFTKPLKNDYDLTDKNLKLCLGEIDQRSDEASWGRVFNVPEDITNPNSNTINLLTHYGQLTLDQVRAFATTFIGHESRLAQIDSQLATCLLKSLTTSAKCSLELEASKYKINDTKVGILILKVAQLKARPDTQFTNDALRNSLRRLDQVMDKSGQDIEKFNLHVRDLISSLASRGQVPESSLYTDLINGYRACTDKIFVDYICRKQEIHDESPVVRDVMIEAEDIMLFATNKYRQLLDQGLWKPVQSKQDDDIIALKAEVEKLKSLKNNKSKKEWVKAAWKSVAPTEGQAKIKNTNGKTYHWCPNHQEWTIHKPEECYKTPSGAPVAQPENGGGSPALRLSEALSAIAMQD